MRVTILHPHLNDLLNEIDRLHRLIAAKTIQVFHEEERTLFDPPRLTRLEEQPESAGLSVPSLERRNGRVLKF
jgi:hypothetical protein